MDAGTRAERAAADWLARRDGEGWQAADEAALEAWLGAEPAHRVAFLRLQAAWDETVRLK
ncbi:FecR/PupR family sigma factor regulator, partial [Arenimonas composti]